MDCICKSTVSWVDTGETWISDVSAILVDDAARWRNKEEAANSKSKKKKLKFSHSKFIIPISGIAGFDK